MVRRSLVQLRHYDQLQVIETLRQAGIRLYHFRKVDVYTYRFYLATSDTARLSDFFSEYKVVQELGLVARIKKLLVPRMMVALVVSVMLFSFLRQRIFIIDVQGDSDLLLPLVTEKLTEVGIKKWAPLSSSEALAEKQYQLQVALDREIEYIEVRQVGVKVKVRYQKRRQAPDLPQARGSLYATKDGIIKAFDVKRGLIVVKEKQFVRAGQLLVNEYLMTTSGEEIHLGCEGIVLAYTWLFITKEVVISEPFDEAGTFSDLLLQARGEVASHLTSGEYIDKETLISHQKVGNIYQLKVNYILVEDITI